MVRRWLAANASLAITSVSGAVVAALVATVAVVSGGYEAQRLDLGDGSIWVANGSEEVVGRANTEVLELDTIVGGTGSDVQVLQDAANVLLLDRSDSTLDIVDQATAEITESVALPSEAPEVFLAGGSVVVHATGTGEVWVVPVSDIADFDSESEPTRAFGTDAVATLTPSGILFVYSPAAEEVYRLDTAAVDTVHTSVARFGDAGDDLDITAVSGRWVLLDRSTGQLSIEGRVVDLSGVVDEPQRAALQQPTESGDRILVSHPDGIVSTTVAGADPVELDAARSRATVATAPLVVGSCAYAAWSSGTAWRECDGAAETFPLDQMPTGAARLALVQRGDRVALNDPRTGSTWAVQERGELIDNWDELIEDEQDLEEVEENDQDVPPEYETDQVPPIAVDDDFGARPGRASILPVLLNDYDPNGDVLVVSDVEQADESVGRIEIVSDRQQLRLTLAPDASGVITFGYTADDGRGGSAGATVTVTVRQPGENGAPIQVRRSRGVVAIGQSVTTPVLGDWLDPDGDAFYLASATIAPPDAVTYRPEGTVVFTDGNGASGLRSVGLVVSDGSAEGIGDLVLSVSENPRLTADQVPFTTYAGRALEVAPLGNVRGGSGDYRLSSVPAKPGATTEVNLDAGTFRFTSDQVRSHFIDYVVTDGDQTVTGIVRIDVLPSPDVSTTPITIPKTIFVRTQDTETIDIASSDIDPAGGVLLLTSVDVVPPSSGLGLEILDQRALRVTLIGPLDAGPVIVGYRVSNGLATAEGTVTIVEIPPPLRYQPPVAADDTVTVRVGDAIDIPVLANDEQPDGEDLTLDPELVTGLPRSAGLLFASGDVLRYLAPDRTGNFTAVYQVRGPGDQVGQAEVRIAVREAVVETNRAPVPRPITARVLAGQSVRIPVPLSGTDPDGDSVQFLGQETNPARGTVTDTGPDYIEYLAGDYSAGTDSFTYTLIDALGARATGTVRVGIAPRTEGPRSPVAVADSVSIRPGKTVSVQVLENDSDPDGGQLTVIGADPSAGDVAAEIIDGAIIDVSPPPVEGEYGLVYTIENPIGGTSSNFVTVVVDADAPPAYPDARDTVLTLSDIVDRSTIEVDVLRNVFFADGSATSLTLSVLPGYDDAATVTARKRLSVTVQDQRQIIPFAVANPDDPSRVSYAFVWVPGLADALPQLNRTVRTPTIASGAPLTIDINDYVLAVGGRQVRLADSTSVQATQSNGAPLVVDDRTLRYTSAPAYSGPASISFEVTDGRAADDPDGRRATLVLPIIVTPLSNQPPVFAGGVIGFEPGQERTIDLLRLTTYTDPDGLDELRFTALGTPPAGFSYRITGAELVIRADEEAKTGTSQSLTLGVRDAASDGQSGRLQLDVVASTRPLARPAPDLVIAPRGRTTTVDVLANDEATNPFPGRALRVLGIRGLDGSSLPAGVSIEPSADNSRLSVTVAADVQPADTTLQYQLADATGDAERYVFGSVRVSVQDRPDAPLPPSRAEGGFEAGQVTLRIAPPLSNNSPITNYIVTSSSNGQAYRHDCGPALRCALTDLAPGRRYQFSVAAINGVGTSDPSPVSADLSADYLPAAPTAVSVSPTRSGGGPALAIAWSAVPNPSPGSGVSSYVVRVSGPGVDYSATVPGSQTALAVTSAAGVRPNAQYTATVYARNAALVLSDADWRSATSDAVTAVGPPGEVSGLTATSDSGGNIQVTWNGSDPNGGTLQGYRIVQISAGGTPPGCSANIGQEATSPWVDYGAGDGGVYQYVVYARNGLFCTATVSEPVESRSAPGRASGTTSVEYRGTGQYDLRVGGLSVASGSAVRYEVDINGRGWRPVPGDWLTSTEDLRDYGAPLTVSYRGCRDQTQSLCGESSAGQTLVAVNTRAQITSCVVGQAPQPTRPVNANVAGERYRYLYNTGLGWEDPAGYVEDTVVPAPLPGTDRTLVRVKAAITISGEAERVDEGYGESSCQ